ncbi:MAG: hypothetical protein EAZ97_14560 [Bacteroidetes bacterium]|nr:MAG: hypothetical protein EAZ97_14560 [Bacteroidota bacterium]
MKDQDDDHILLSDNGIFLGLLLLAFFAFVPSFLFGDWYMYFFYVFTGVLGIVGIEDLIFSARKLEITGKELWVYKGLNNSLQKYSLEDVEFIGMGKDEQDARKSKILDLDLDSPLANDQWKVVVIDFKGGKKLKLNDYRYKGTQYKPFIKKFKDTCMELGVASGSTDKIQKIRLQNSFYIKKDQALIRNLNENLAEVYASIYKSRDMNTANLSIESILKDASIIFAHKVSDLRVLYFQKDDFLEDVEQANIETAERLIRNASENMLVVKERLKNYLKIQSELDKLQKKQEQRSRLERAAQKLDRLQEQNFKGDYLRTDTQHETEIIKQLALLNDVISEAESMDQVTLLEQKIELFKQQMG